MKIHFVIIGIVLFLSEYSYAEKTNKILSDSSNVSTKTKNYIDLKFSNDILYKTDYYFTNGLSLEIQLDRLALRISNRLSFFKGYNIYRRYWYTLSQKIYTPVNYTTKRINYKDRPYAGVLTITYMEAAYSDSKKQSFGIQLGVIGKPAGSEQIQNFIHSSINNNLAKGWYGQISSDLIINFNYAHAKQIYYSKSMDLTGQAEINLGTLRTDLAADLQFRIGKRIYKFGNSGPNDNTRYNNNWQLYLYMGVTPRFVLYNATLQGGLFNPLKDYHAFTYNEIESLIFELRTGITLGYKNYNLTFQVNQITPEFKGGKAHAWGTISFQYDF